MSVSLAPFALAVASIVLHEGHGHDGAASGGVEVTTLLLAIVAVGVVGAGTWYAYRNGLLSG